METLVAWFKISQYGLPHWGWALITAFAMLEMALGRSENPKWRSVGDSLRNGLDMVLSAVLLKVPAGVFVLQLLRTMKVLPPVNVAP